MKIAIRADASLQQGTGHLMRCLVLADELRLRGHECLFVTQPYLPLFTKKIHDHNHKVIILPMGTLDQSVHIGHDEYLSWLGRSTKHDALVTLEALKNENIDILIADHYAIDHSWMDLFSGQKIRKVIIDDLANRKHCCDILIDQNFGRSPQDYEHLVSKKTKVFTGSEYVILKDDFKITRNKSQLTRLNREPKCLNICMGGMDKDNSTYNILETVLKSGYFKKWSIDVVLRSSSPHAKMISNYSDKSPHNINLHFDCENMATLFEGADLAIGAGGVTLWERCCVGLPTLLLTIADNQVPAAMAMSRSGAIIYCGDIREKDWKKKLDLKLKMLTQDTDRLHLISKIAFGICDGNGLEKVCNIIESN